MYWKWIWIGIALFLLYWIALPIALISVGSLMLSGDLPSWVQTLGRVLAPLGFVFGMVSASYALIDGGGVAYCCPPKKLVRCGTYSMCRHPMYLGFVIYILGLSMKFGRAGALLISLIFSASIVLFALLYEERKLIEKYGKDYEEYRKKVPAFFPKLPERDDRCPPLLFQLLFYVGHVISWFTWDIRFEKECEVPEEGYVVVSNHVTYLDFAVVIYTLSRFVSFPVSKFHYERHKWLYDLVGSFPIKRHEPDVRAIMKIISFVRRGGRLGIFPEAERSWDGRFLGFKEGFDKLFSKIPKPIIGLRIEKAHLLYPRWGKRFYPGRVFVEVKCFEDPKELEEFLSKPSVDPKDTYPSYKGVEKYVYMCPKCGSFHSMVSSKNGFRCEKCGFKMKKPTVGDLWRIHDEIFEKLQVPYEEEGELVDVYGKPLGKRVKVRIEKDRLVVDGKVMEKESVKSFIAEGRREVFFNTEEGMIGFRFKSALLWSDIVEKFWGI